jgi:hypothetical protein
VARSFGSIGAHHQGPGERQGGPFFIDVAPSQRQELAATCAGRDGQPEEAEEWSVLPPRASAFLVNVRKLDIVWRVSLEDEPLVTDVVADIAVSLHRPRGPSAPDSQAEPFRQYEVDLDRHTREADQAARSERAKAGWARAKAQQAAAMGRESSSESMQPRTATEASRLTRTPEHGRPLDREEPELMSRPELCP